MALNCAIGSDFPTVYKLDKRINVHALISPVLEPRKTYNYIITFGDKKGESKMKNAELSQKCLERIASQFERYEKLRKSMPVLVSPNNELNNYFSLLPMYHESLKIPDHPGAIRAKTSNYWVWGWDGMTLNNSTAYWGDTKHIKNLLSFIRETADPEKGIIHRFSYDMKPLLIQTIPAQSMYIALLQLYYDQTNDIEELKRNYEFAKKIFDLVLTSEVKQTGLFKGLSHYPDFPDLTGETGNDISGLNNSVVYCASRSLNRLAAVIGDKETLKKTQEINQKMESNFLKYFYNKEKKYIVSSIDAGTFENRQDYQSGSLRWENSYYRDLIDPVLKDAMDFYANHLVCKAGIRLIPPWCSSFDGDANQLHSWWPCTDESFLRMINEFDRRDLTDQWIGWLTYWYKNLTCPEGISCLLETDKPELDRWSALKGTWYAMTMRSWYQGIIHSVVGVDADAGGITFYPYSGEEMKLLGMHYLGKTFDIDMKGSGSFIDYIEVNGKKILGTNKLPLEYYQNEQKVSITVKRTGIKPYPVIVKYGAGIVLKDYTYNKGVINAKLTGAGDGRLYFLADKAPVIKVGGKKVNVVYNEQSRLATINLVLTPDKDLPVLINP